MKAVLYDSVRTQYMCVIVSMYGLYMYVYMYTCTIHIRPTLTGAAAESLVAQKLLKFPIPVSLAYIATVQGEE